MAIEKKTRAPAKTKKTPANASTAKFKQSSASSKKIVNKVVDKNVDETDHDIVALAPIEPRKLGDTPDLVVLPPVFTTDSK